MRVCWEKGIVPREGSHERVTEHVPVMIRRSLVDVRIWKFVSVPTVRLYCFVVLIRVLPFCICGALCLCTANVRRWDIDHESWLCDGDMILARALHILWVSDICCTTTATTFSDLT